MTLRALALAGVCAAIVTPRRALTAAPTLCLVRRATGRPCPTCGLTRSWVAAGHGDIRDALALHPFGPPTLAAAAAFALAGPRHFDFPALRSTPVLVALAGAWVAVWLVRFARRSA